MSLRKRLIRCAYYNKDLRPQLLPFLKEGGDLSKLPPALREQAEKKMEEAKKNKEKDKDKEKDKEASLRRDLIRLAYHNKKHRKKILALLED